MGKNELKSYNDLNKPETHSTEVLLSTIEELERTKKQLEIAVKALHTVLRDEFILEHADAGLIMYLAHADCKIKELEK